MARYSVIVRRLNQRKFPVEDTSRKGNVTGQVTKGFEFEGALALTNRIGDWYKDNAGNYYWGGGISSAVSGMFAVPGPDKMSWAHRYYDIPGLWNRLKTQGERSLVAVIDTGVDHMHEDIKGALHSSSKGFVGDPLNITDADGHGTRMAGIIAGSGKRSACGVAPGARLCIIKATNSQNEFDLNTFSDAVRYAASIEAVDIISVSYAFIRTSPALEQAMRFCLDHGKIVVCAIGNYRNILVPEDIDTFPAAYTPVQPRPEGLIAVGAFDSAGAVCSFSNRNRHLRCVAPGNKLLTTNLGNTAVPDTGTSIATAFVAGALALLVSYVKSNAGEVAAIVPAFLEACDGSAGGLNIESGFGRVDLNKTIIKLNMV